MEIWKRRIMRPLYIKTGTNIERKKKRILRDAV